jgi:hypothetical protein
MGPEGAGQGGPAEQLKTKEEQRKKRKKRKERWSHTCLVFAGVLGIFMLAYWLVPLHPQPASTNESWIDQIIDVRIILAALHVAVFGGIVFLITSIAVAVFKNKPLVSFLGGMKVADTAIEGAEDVEGILEEAAHEGVIAQMELVMAFDHERRQAEAAREADQSKLKKVYAELQKEQEARRKVEGRLLESSGSSSQ